jgi:hypothetical protein
MWKFLISTFPSLLKMAVFFSHFVTVISQVHIITQKKKTVVNYCTEACCLAYFSTITNFSYFSTVIKIFHELLKKKEKSLSVNYQKAGAQ